MFFLDIVDKLNTLLANEVLLEITAPPPPVVIILFPLKLKIPISPKVPTCFFIITP